jgi:hypothetical protein
MTNFPLRGAPDKVSSLGKLMVMVEEELYFIAMMLETDLPSIYLVIVMLYWCVTAAPSRKVSRVTVMPLPKYV